jgi:hypothetical protein
MNIQKFKIKSFTPKAATAGTDVIIQENTTARIVAKVVNGVAIAFKVTPGTASKGTRELIIPSFSEAITMLKEWGTHEQEKNVAWDLTRPRAAMKTTFLLADGNVMQTPYKITVVESGGKAVNFTVRLGTKSETFETLGETVNFIGAW